MRTKRGRDQVELMLRDFERQQGLASGMVGFDIARLRAELGVPA